MFNPLVTDLSQLSDQEIYKKLEELWYKAQTMRNHPLVHSQFNNLIQVYTDEINRRKNKTE